MVIMVIASILLNSSALGLSNYVVKFVVGVIELGLDFLPCPQGRIYRVSSREVRGRWAGWHQHAISI